MNKQKKPLYWYYLVILIVLLLVNMIIGPLFANNHIKEVTYSDFLDSIEEKQIQDVEVHDTEIYYTVKGDEETVYQTGAMQDAQLVDRLDEAGANFTKVQTEEMNPLLSYLITLFLPLLIFWGLGSFLLPPDAEEDGQGCHVVWRRRRLRPGRLRQEQCQGLCAGAGRQDLQGCGWSG